MTLKYSDTVELYSITVMEGTAQNNSVANSDNDLRVVKGHSTLVAKNGNYAWGQDPSWSYSTQETGTAGTVVYQNNSTVYFYVTGDYDNKTLSVTPITGIKNVINFRNGQEGVDGTTNTGIAQLFVNEPADARYTAKAMLVMNVAAGDSDVYFYNQGSFDVEPIANSDKYQITFHMYNADGDAYDAVYTTDSLGGEFETSTQAFNFGNDIDTGYYTLGARALLDVDRNDPWTGAASETVVVNSTRYVVNANADYDEYVDNLYDDTILFGTITEETRVVDLTGNDLNSIARIVSALRADRGGSLTVSYSYGTGDLVTDVMYVTDYNPSETPAPGGVTGATIDELKLESTGNAGELEVTLNLSENVSGYAVFQLQYSNDNGATWHDIFTPVEVAFAYDEATHTFEDLPTSADGMVFRVMASSKAGLVTSLGNNAVNIIGEVSNTALCK